MRISQLFGLLIAVTLMSTTACKKDSCNCLPSSDTDYLVFGHFYGECIGEQCIEIFKLTDEALFEDTQDKYPSSQSAYEGTFEALPEATFNEVSDLINQVPEALLNEPNGVIGMPDAGDWGGYYIEVQRDGVVQFWLIDTMEDNIPAFLHDFNEQVRTAITAIND